MAGAAKIQHVDEITPYVTKDGSVIREIIHPDRFGQTNQSLAEATIAPGKGTFRHKHSKSEEIYFVTAGTGMVEVDGNEIPAAPGTAVLIPPGAIHRAVNTGGGELKILCCCAPPYSHEDTILLDPGEGNR